MIELFLILAVVGSLGIVAWIVLKLRRPNADRDEDWSAMSRLEPSGWSSGVVTGAAATAASAATAAPIPVVDASASFGAGASFSGGADAGGGGVGGGSN